MKNFNGLQEKGRNAVLAFLSRANTPMKVSEISKNLNLEDFQPIDSLKFRQFVQNLVDRLVRHGELKIIKGTKRTGRPVNLYALSSFETTENLI